jgi:hypothetical protein
MRPVQLDSQHVSAVSAHSLPLQDPRHHTHTMRYCMTTYNLPASLAAASGLLLALLCALAAAPVAEAGKMCPSGLLCPDSGWYCCSPRRESCCKNIGTGGPFGRRLK